MPHITPVTPFSPSLPFKKKKEHSPSLFSVLFFSADPEEPGALLPCFCCLAHSPELGDSRSCSDQAGKKGQGTERSRGPFICIYQEEPNALRKIISPRRLNTTSHTRASGTPSHRAGTSFSSSLCMYVESPSIRAHCPRSGPRGHQIPPVPLIWRSRLPLLCAM